MKANDYLDDKKPTASSFLESDQPTGFKTKSLAELLSTYGQPNTLNEGAKVVSGVPGVIEVGARRGYAGIGKVEQGALSILGDMFNSEALRNASDAVGNRARQIENSAVLRGQNTTGFAPDSIVNDLPEAGANAVSSVVQTAPSLLAGALAPGVALPALFAQTFGQEYAQGKDAGLTPLKATGRAIPMAAFEVAGEKLGGFDRLAEGLRAATRGNGVADLGSAMVASALKEIPSEEFTTTGQFLTDKAPVIGLNQDATLADYGQQLKDTALATALQSGAMGGAGRIIQGRTLQAPSIMENIQPSPQDVQPQPTQTQVNAPAVVDAINQAVSNVKPSAIDFLEADTTEAPNVSELTQQQPAGLDPATVGPELNNVAGSPAIEFAQPDANAGIDSAAPNGALPASDISDGVAPGEPVAGVGQQSSNPLQLPIEFESEAKNSPAYNDVSLPDDVKSMADQFNAEEVNKLLSEAGYVEPRQPESKGASSASQIENTQPQSAASSIAGDPRRETVQTARVETAAQNEVAGTPGSNEREGTRQQVEAIVKRRAAANQLGKLKPFDNALKLAKDFMNGENVAPTKFKNAAILFANDKPLADAFTALQELAKSPAKESRQSARSAVDIFTDEINNAQTVDQLKSIARNIQMETGVLNDAMAQQLDDLVMARIDALSQAETDEAPERSNETPEQSGEKNQYKVFVRNGRKESSFIIVKRGTGEAQSSEIDNTENNIKALNQRNLKPEFEAIGITDYLARQNKSDAESPAATDLLGDNTENQQAIADAERAKDEKRNTGVDNASDFVLTGSDRSADQAAARGAQDLFDDKNTERGYEYSKPGSIDTPLQGQLNEARKNKEAVSKQLKQLRLDYKEAPLGSGRNSIKLNIIRAESRLNEYKKLETDTLNSIEKRANELGKTIIKNKGGPAFKSDHILDAIANIKRQQNQVVDQVQAYVDAIAKGWKNAPSIQVVYDMNDERVPEAVRKENDRQLSQGATGQPQGFIIRGKVFIIASEMSGEKDVLRTLFHESLGHYGLRGLYNEPALNAALDRVATMRATDVAKKAKQYGLNINNPSDRLIAAEEVLAEMAETKPEIGVVKQVIAAIRAWLRDNIPYFKNLELSDAEIIRDYILPARRYVEAGGKEQTAGDVVAAFQRGEPQDESLPDTITVNSIQRPTLNSNGMPIQNAVNNANLLNMRLNIKDNGKYLKSVPIHAIESSGDKSIYIDEHGNVQLLTQLKFKSISDLQREAELLLQEYFSPLKENQFVRVATSKDDYYHLINGTHRGSKNWATGMSEGGLSVAKIPQPVDGGEYAYIVEGEKVGNGSDGEPLLDLNTVKPITKPIEINKFNKDYQKSLIENLKSLGIDEDDYRILVTGGKVTKEEIPSAIGNTGSSSPNSDSILFSRTQKQTSITRDELGRFKSPTGIIYDKTSDIVQTLAQKVAFGQAPKELRTMTRLYKADIQKAMDAASNVVKTMAPMSQIDRALVSDVVEKMVATGVTPPESIVKIATGMQNAMDIQTDELVSLGMLSQDSADRWRGKYLPRFYMRENTEGVKAWVGKMLRNSLPVRGIGGNSLKGRGLFEEVNVNEVPKYEALGWEVRDPLWKKNRQGELELMDANKVVTPEKVVVWRDWTPSERDEMGENRDALFRFVMGYTSMQNDIALGRLFDSIAKNQEWTRARASEGYVKVPDSEIPETGGVKRYGNLAGLYVKKEILDHISQYEEASELWKYYRKALSFWKAGKTVLNPVAHVNNVVSNLTMAHFAGVSYWDAHKYIGAIKDFVKDAPMIQEAKDRGLMTGDITRAELMSDMPDDIKAMMEMQESAIKRKSATVFNIITFGLSKPMGKAYRFEDDFFKYLIYRDARKNGLSPDDAVDYATKYIFTYDDLPKGARTVRDLAIPFFAYTYKAVPALTHTLFNYPWRFAAPAAAVWGVNAIAYALAAGDDDDDWQTMYEKGKELEEDERDNLPPWMRGRSALGAQKSIRLGTDEKTQLPVYMDVSRMIPGGDIFDVTNQADGVPVPAPIMPSNPVLTTIAAMFWNKDTFTGKEVIDTNDTGKEAARKRAGWLFKQISPAVAPTGYHFDRLMEATSQMSGEVISIPAVNFGDPIDYTGYGKDGLPVQGKYAIPQTFGIKARPIDLEKSAEIAQGQDNKEIRSIMAEIRQAARLLDQNAISQREYDRRVSDAEAKIEAIESK